LLHGHQCAKWHCNCGLRGYRFRPSRPRWASPIYPGCIGRFYCLHCLPTQVSYNWSRSGCSG
jgi:hypothetical protein